MAGPFIEMTMGSGKKVVVNVDHIVYIEKALNLDGTHVHLREQNGFEVSDPFDSLAKYLVNE